MAEPDRHPTVQAAARVAHDLSNIAAVLNGHIYLLRNAAESAEEACSEMEKAVAQLERLTRSLEKLAATGCTEFCPFDLNEVVRQAVADPGNDSNPLTLDLEESLPEIHGRQGDVREALDCLLANARESRPQEIRVFTGRLADGSGVLLGVEDSGEGIPPALREKVFEPLFSTKGEKGRGIGLTLVASVAADHGASCRIEPRPGGGTRVTLRFPAGQESHRAPTARKVSG